MRKPLPEWTNGIIKTLKSNNCRLPDQYSWRGFDDEGRYVFITESDHKDKDSAKMNLKEGWVVRNILPVDSSGKAATLRHSKEVCEAISHAYDNQLPVRVLLTKYTKYSSEPKRETKAMLLPWIFHVRYYSGGNVEQGYQFRLEKIVDPTQ